MKSKLAPIIAGVIVLLFIVQSAFFIVDQTKQAIVVQLGKPVSGVKKPGLHGKIPFIQEVIFFESRLLDYDASPAEILTHDKKNLMVDNYAKWKIIDPLQFYKTVRNITGALSRLDDIIYAELRVELGRHLMIDIISTKRETIMHAVTERSNEQAKAYGISVVDVRIKRADLPQENEQAVFGRMRTERDRQAKKYRSEGQREALKIRATADRERSVILAEAYRKAQEIRGQGDAEATRVYAEAYLQDPEFFDFLKSLESYRRSLNKRTTIILSPRDEFLKFLKESGTDLRPPTEEKEIVMPQAEIGDEVPGTEAPLVDGEAKPPATDTAPEKDKAEPAG